MRYRRLGKTDLEVSVIGFGGIKLNPIPSDQAVSMITRALDLGVNFLDTARNYGDSERKIGLAVRGRRDDVYLATKTSARSFDGAMRDTEASLKQLDVERIDLLQLHTVSDEATYQQVMSSDGAFRALRKAQDQGIADHLGISVHRAHSVMLKAIRSGEFETLMVAYSPLDQEGVREQILPTAKQHDLGVIVMKPLSGGLLARPGAEKKPRPRRDPIVFGSLWHIISNDAVSTVIPGMQTLREVEENVPVGDVAQTMPDKAFEKLIHEIGKLGIEYRYGQVCLRCEYCQPCPQGVAIPDALKAYDVYVGYSDNLKHLGLDLYRSIKVGPQSCVECGQCEEKCPAHLPIRELLKKVAQTLGPLA